MTNIHICNYSNYFPLCQWHFRDKADADMDICGEGCTDSGKNCLCSENKPHETHAVHAVFGIFLYIFRSVSSCVFSRLPPNPRPAFLSKEAGCISYISDADRRWGVSAMGALLPIAASICATSFALHFLAEKMVSMKQQESLLCFWEYGLFFISILSNPCYTTKAAACLLHAVKVNWILLWMPS